MRFEYAVERLERSSSSGFVADGPRIEALLDAYGKKGWRLASLSYTPDGVCVMVFEHEVVR